MFAVKCMILVVLGGRQIFVKYTCCNGAASKWLKSDNRQPIAEGTRKGNRRRNCDLRSKTHFVNFNIKVHRPVLKKL